MTEPIVPLASLETAPMLALNQAHKAETSDLTAPVFDHLVATAFYARGIAPAEAFLIAFDETADYGSPNFHYFRERYPSFAYIDRIITAAHARGKGYARRLYEDMFDLARAAGKPMVCCEVNADPPNPGSDAFHARLGFTVVGTASLDNGKTVRYLIKPL